MNVTVCSIFRNSASYVDRYLTQAKELSRHVDLRLVLTYGDCTDTTAAALADYGRMMDLADRMEVERFDHGGPRFGSVDVPERWDQIAKVVRFTLDRVGDPGDALVWVESDLLWPPETMLRLLDDLTTRVPSVAPQVLAEGTERFYDTWGMRRNGRMFSPHLPYHDGTPDPFTDLIHIDSCGSCFVTGSHDWHSWSGHWPYKPDGGLWLDPAATVRHP